MAVYIVTGKLGSGKSLVTVARIFDYLTSGRPVATNIDLNLHKLVNPDAKKTVVYRLPDKPTVKNFEEIGYGNLSADESKNGLIALDELGTWFNSRKWNDKERQPVIDWFLHARKRGWDVLLLVQDISIIDNQLRDALAEHVVYCKRFDRLKIPFFSPLVSVLSFGLFSLRFPRIHCGVVKYGDSPNSPTVDTWLYRGTIWYKAYNTKQIFTAFDPLPTSQSVYGGTACLLPPYQYFYQYYKRPEAYKMRLTKIYFKKFSRPLAFFLGAIFAVTLSRLLPPDQNPATGQLVQASSEEPYHLDDTLGKTQEEIDPDFLKDWSLIGYAATEKKGARFIFSDPQGVPVYSEALQSDGYKFRRLSDRVLAVTKGINSRHFTY